MVKIRPYLIEAISLFCGLIKYMGSFRVRRQLYGEENSYILWFVDKNPKRQFIESIFLHGWDTNHKNK